MEILITAGGTAMLILEGLKWLIRTLMKNPTYDFPTKFYIVALAALNTLVIPLLALLGVEGFVMPIDWVGFARVVLQVTLSSLISVFGYTNALKPLKTYAEIRKYNTAP
jgi:hypothetical protein